MIKLKVHSTEVVKLKVGEVDTANFKASEGVPIYPNPYTGNYTVTPTGETQTLSTADLMMTQDVTVNPIPSNYGLITWNGSTLTVS